jgi:hypothetical protein
MKKLVSLVLLAVVVGGGWWMYSKQASESTGSTSASSGAATGGSNTQTALNGSAAGTNADTRASINAVSQTMPSNVVGDGSEMVEEVRPAAMAYASAEEALAAAIKGAKDFDDSILEQFTEPSADCSWCAAFYNSIQELVTNPDTPQDQKSYMAEILAISGRPENVQVLVDSIKNAKNSAEADIYAEALELSLGKDDVTKVLGEQLSTTNDTLREASVAAITNQGSRSAAELLEKHIQERNDPDAYYAQGTGPGEFIPDEDALPLVQEYVARRDAYSPKWALAMINAGLPGLQALFDQLESSSNPEADRNLIKGAIDHVNFEDGVKELADTVALNNKNPAAVELAKQIQEELSAQETDEAEGTTQP